jgi:hypothetical protein
MEDAPEVYRRKRDPLRPLRASTPPQLRVIEENAQIALAGASAFFSRGSLRPVDDSGL